MYWAEDIRAQQAAFHINRPCCPRRRHRLQECWMVGWLVVVPVRRSMKSSGGVVGAASGWPGSTGCLYARITPHPAVMHGLCIRTSRGPILKILHSGLSSPQPGRREANRRLSDILSGCRSHADRDGGHRLAVKMGWTLVMDRGISGTWNLAARRCGGIGTEKKNRDRTNSTYSYFSAAPSSSSSYSSSSSVKTAQHRPECPPPKTESTLSFPRRQHPHSPLFPEGYLKMPLE